MADSRWQHLRIRKPSQWFVMNDTFFDCCVSCQIKLIYEKFVIIINKVLRGQQRLISVDFSKTSLTHMNKISAIILFGIIWVHLLHFMRTIIRETIQKFCFFQICIIENMTVVIWEYFNLLYEKLGFVADQLLRDLGFFEKYA